MKFFPASGILLTFKVIAALTMVCATLLPLRVDAGHNPALVVTFRVNMSRAAHDSLFTPGTDRVFLVPGNGADPVQLVPEPGSIYSIVLEGVSDSGVIFPFRFRINDSLSESVSWSVLVLPGMDAYSAWWNNEPFGRSTFSVNMEYAVQYGLFDPATDSVTITGSTWGSSGSPKLTRDGADLRYTLTDTLLAPGNVISYKYRINTGDTAKNQLELLFLPDRIVRIPDTSALFASDFNNFNPALRLMTFRCNMSYYARTGRFDPAADYLDVAGNFNGSGANDILFDPDGDTVYTLGLYLDTAWISQGPLSFRFRINGNPSLAELAGKPDRTYAFHDTTGQNPNLFTCYYNDTDPSIPAPPVASALGIQGLLIYKKILSGSYAYENVNGIPEGKSLYRWLRSDNALGVDAIPIDSANLITYVVDTLDIGKWLVFEVTPKAASGYSSVGLPVRVVSSGSISAWDVGLADTENLISLVFPNPATDRVRIITLRGMDFLEIFDLTNRRVMVKRGNKSQVIEIVVSDLPRGLYIVRATTADGTWGTARFLKQ